MPNKHIKREAPTGDWKQQEVDVLTDQYKAAVKALKAEAEWLRKYICQESGRFMQNANLRATIASDRLLITQHEQTIARLTEDVESWKVVSRDLETARKAESASLKTAQKALGLKYEEVESLEADAAAGDKYYETKTAELELLNKKTFDIGFGMYEQYQQLEERCVQHGSCGIAACVNGDPLATLMASCVERGSCGMPECGRAAALGVHNKLKKDNTQLIQDNRNWQEKYRAVSDILYRKNGTAKAAAWLGDNGLRRDSDSDSDSDPDGPDGDRVADHRHNLMKANPFKYNSDSDSDEPDGWGGTNNSGPPQHGIVNKQDGWGAVEAAMND